MSASRRCSTCCRVSRSSTATARRRPAGWPTALGPGPRAPLDFCRPRARSSSPPPRGAAPRPRRRFVFPPAGGRIALSADRRRVLEPGDGEIGWTARRGRVPLGYLGARKWTEETFPLVDGQRFAVPGDRATIGPDGSIRMLGRDSMVVNTGGEKVFVEEVE